MKANRIKAKQGKLRPLNDRAKLIGELIRAARKELVRDAFLNQNEFYQRCRSYEKPSVGKRKGVAFAAEEETAQRRHVVAWENGQKELKPRQKRIVEEVVGWPSGALDGEFKTADEFRAYCASLLVGKTLVAPPGELDAGAARTSGTSLDVASGSSEASKRRPKNKPNYLSGIRAFDPGRKPLASRTRLADEIHAGLLSATEPLSVVVIQGEAGVGKTHLIAEWWHRKGRKDFTKNTFAIDCSRLGGDQILQSISSHFLAQPTSVLTAGLVDAISQLSGVLIILEGLSGEDSLGTAGRTDRVALTQVRELVNFMARYGVRASFLLGVQTAEPDDALIVANQLSASASLAIIRVQRLSPEEGADTLEQLGVSKLSRTDLLELSRKLEGLPISLSAAANYLREASPRQVEAFLIKIESRGRNFKFFEEFFGRYLDAMRGGPFSQAAHPHAYLRLLALMPGRVPKERVDNLLQQRKITRLEEGTSELFSDMRIDFVSEYAGHIDINPMIRGLLRQEIKRAARSGEDTTITQEELRWIHAFAASRCLTLLPEDESKVSGIGIEYVEGALYHLLEFRDCLPAGSKSDWRPTNLEDWAGLFDDERASTDAITQYCLMVVRQFLVGRNFRATRILGLYETKARLLSMFFESEDEGGKREILSIADQAFVYTEAGVCWMHAGRLQLAFEALSAAARCFSALGVADLRRKALNDLTDADKELWKEWSNSVSTMALILMRLGRPRELVVEPSIADAVAFAESLAHEAMMVDAPLGSHNPVLHAARRILCRRGHVALNGGDQAAADRYYRLAVGLEQLMGSSLNGDALRRRIDVLVLRGPCLMEDITTAEALLEPHLVTTPHLRQSNDIIAMKTTKIMLLRAKGAFAAAGQLIGETSRNDILLRGECPFAARMEFELEKFRLKIAMNEIGLEDQRTLRLIAQEAHNRHHLMLYWDAMLLVAETEDEPSKSQILDLVEAQSFSGGWHRRNDAIEWMRSGGNAVQAFGC